MKSSFSAELLGTPSTSLSCHHYSGLFSGEDFFWAVVSLQIPSKDFPHHRNTMILLLEVTTDLIMYIYIKSFHAPIWGGVSRTPNLIHIERPYTTQSGRQEMNYIMWQRDKTGD